MCIFALSVGEHDVNVSCWIRLFTARRSDGKTEDCGLRVGVGDTLFDCYLVAKGSLAFELERCGGMNTCTAPPLRKCMDTFHLVSVCSTQRGPEKKRAARWRKESIQETSPRLSVWGQGAKITAEGVCQVLSGADKPM